MHTFFSYKSRSLYFLLCCSAVLFLSGCHYTGLHRSYAPIQQSPNQFTQAKDQRLAFEAGLNQIQIQAGHAHSDSWGISALGFLGYQGQWGAGFSAIYFKKLASRTYWEMNGGYRYVRNFSHLIDRATSPRFPSPALYYTDYYSQSGQVIYHELPIESHLVFDTRENGIAQYFYKKLGLSLQISPVWFEHYNFRNKTEEAGCEGCIGTTNHMFTKNKAAIAITPGFNIWFGSKDIRMYMRTGFTFVSSIGQARGISSRGFPQSDVYFDHPEWVPFYLQLGIELNRKK